MAQDLAGVPLYDPIVDLPDGVSVPIRRDWAQWLGSVIDAVNNTPARVVHTRKTNQQAAIGATTLITPTTGPQLFRVSYYARISQAATTSSSLTVTIAWTDGAVACSQAGAAITGNTTATVQAGTILVRADAATAITFSTAYASVGATPMKYHLDVTVEQVA